MVQRIAEGRRGRPRSVPPAHPAAGVGIARKKLVQRVMDESAALRRAGIGIERVERPQLQNMPRIERIGIAHPGFDGGDRQVARPRRERRARRPAARGLHRRRARRAALPGERPAVGRANAKPGRAQHRFQPRAASATARSACHRPARRGSAPLRGAAAPAQNHGPRCRCAPRAAAGRSCGRIGRDIHGSCDRPRGQTPSFSPPRIDQIGLLQPRFEQAPDRQPRMRP